MLNNKIISWQLQLNPVSGILAIALLIAGCVGYFKVTAKLDREYKQQIDQFIAERKGYVEIIREAEKRELEYKNIIKKLSTRMVKWEKQDESINLFDSANDALESLGL